MADLLLMFWEFFKAGLFAIGGGMATLPFLFDISYAHPEWYTPQMLTDMVAVSESTPGPVGINMATYVGMTVHGIPGVVFAVVGLVLPSFLITVIIARFLDRYRQNRIVNSVFRTIRPVAIVMIFAGFLSVADVALFTSGSFALLRGIAFAVFTLLIYLFGKKVHPLWWILLGALLGMIAL